MIDTPHADTLSLIDARYWLECAVTAKGARVGFVSINDDHAEIVITLEDRRYIISIREENHV
jgi:hypothetical protein